MHKILLAIRQGQRLSPVIICSLHELSFSNIKHVAVINSDVMSSNNVETVQYDSFLCCHTKPF